MWLENVSGSEDHKEKCPTCGGCVQRRAYGEMYAGSFILDGQRVEIRRVPNAGFIDPVVLDAITQYFDGKLHRLWPSEKYFACGGKKLHRRVWEVAFGAIPDGCHIHHRDAIAANNLLSNLECQPSTEHLSSTWHDKHKHRGFTANARDRAVAWHKSEAGLLWHRRQSDSIKTWIKWARVDKPCVECGAVFKAFDRSGPTSQKFCTDVCRVTNYRKRVAAKRAG